MEMAPTISHAEDSKSSSRKRSFSGDVGDDNQPKKLHSESDSENSNIESYQHEKHLKTSVTSVKTSVTMSPIVGCDRSTISYTVSDS